MSDRAWSEDLFGDYSEELADQYGACRVVGLRENGAVVAALDWLGEGIPELEDLEDAPVLKRFWWPNRTEEFPKNRASFGRVTETRPRWWTRIGNVDLSDAEAELGRETSTISGGNGWLAIRISVRQGWEWRNNREEVQRRRERAREELRRETEKRVRAFDSLAEMRQQDHFHSWREYMDDELVDASKRIIDRAIDEFDELPDDVPESKRVDVIRRLVEAFNELNVQHDHFIETLERESIALKIDQLLELVDLAHLGDLDDRWREW